MSEPLSLARRMTGIKLFSILLLSLFILSPLLLLVPSSSATQLTGVHTYILRPNGDDACDFGTIYPASPTTHYDKVASTTAGGDGDSSYVASSLAAQRDHYTLTDLSSTQTPKSIRVSMWIIVMKQASQAANIRAGLWTTTPASADGIDLNPSNAAYTNYSSTSYVGWWTQNPFTSSAWTVSAINALEVFLASSDVSPEVRVTQVAVIVEVNYGWASTFTSTPPVSSHGAYFWPSDPYSYIVTCNESATKTNLLKASWMTWTSANATLWGRVPLLTSNMTVETISMQAQSINGLGYSWQNFSITIQNLPPYFTSTNGGSIYTDEEYFYNATAIDPCGQSVIYALTSTNFTGIELNTVTGQIESDPSHSVGSYYLNISVTDYVNTVYQNSTITVVAHPPPQWAPTMYNNSAHAQWASDYVDGYGYTKYNYYDFPYVTWGTANTSLGFVELDGWPLATEMSPFFYCDGYLAFNNTLNWSESIWDSNCPWVTYNFINDTGRGVGWFGDTYFDDSAQVTWVNWYNLDWPNYTDIGPAGPGPFYVHFYAVSEEGGLGTWFNFTIIDPPEDWVKYYSPVGVPVKPGVSFTYWNGPVYLYPPPVSSGVAYASVPENLTYTGDVYRYIVIPTNANWANLTIEIGPSWLIMDNYTLIGVPNATGAYTISLKLTNGTFSSWQNWTLIVLPPATQTYEYLILGLVIAFGCIALGMFIKPFMFLAGIVWVFIAISVFGNYGIPWLIIGVGIGMVLLIYGARHMDEGG